MSTPNSSDRELQDKIGQKQPATALTNNPNKSAWSILSNSLHSFWKATTTPYVPSHEITHVIKQPKG